MRSGGKVVFGFVSSLLLASVVVAIQQSYLSHLNSEIAASQPQRNAEPVVLRTSVWTPPGPGASEEESGTDAVSDDRTVGPSKRVGPASAVAPPPAGEGSFSRTQASAANEGWSDLIPAALASVSRFGSGGPVTPRPSADSASSSRPTADQGQVREVFFSDHEETACQPGGRQFALEDIRGLYVCVVWAGLGGTYAQQLTFVSPDGHVYQTLTHAFATAQAPAMGTIEVKGRQYAVTRAGWGANGDTLVTAALPVAGTFITQYNLVGLWTVKVSLNSQPIDQDNFELLSRQ